MASYPNAVKSFTSKNAGDTIQPSHINDLQDEVAALEDGLLNGTAPINSSRITAPAAQISNATISSLTVSVLSLTNLQTSNSTTANLNVTSGSTMAALNVTGGSTLATLNVLASAPLAMVSGAAQTVNGGGGTVFALNTNDYVTDASMHSTATNNSRVYPASSGVYLITAQIVYGGLGTDLTTNAYQQIKLRIDGTSNLMQQTVAPIGGGNALTAQILGLYRFASTTQYVELMGVSGIGTPTGTPSLHMSKLR